LSLLQIFLSPASSELSYLQDNPATGEEERTDIARTPQKTSPASGEGKVVLQFPFIFYFGMNERKLLQSRAARSSLRDR